MLPHAVSPLAPLPPAPRRLDAMAPVSFQLDRSASSLALAPDAPRKATVSLCYELLQDQESFEAIDKRGVVEPALFHDTDGSLSLLHINGEGVLFAYRKESNSLHPWSSRDLCAEMRAALGLPPDAHFRAKQLALSPNGDGSYALAVAVEVRAAAPLTAVFFAPRLEDAAATKWFRCSVGSECEAIALSLLPNVDAVAGEHVVFFAGREVASDTVKAVVARVGLKGVASPWSDVGPKGLGRIVDACPGRRAADRGFFLLRAGGDLFYCEVSSWLQSGQQLHSRRVPQDRTTAITAIDSACLAGGPAGLTHLFFGRVVVEAGERHMELCTFTPAQQGNDFRESTRLDRGSHAKGIERVVAVATVDGGVSVYSADQDGALYRSKALAPPDGAPGLRWGPATALDGDVVDFAAAEDRATERGEIFLIRDVEGAQGGITFEWGYETQGAWRYDRVKVEDRQRDLRRRWVTRTNVVAVKVSFRNPDGSAVVPRCDVQTGELRPYRVTINSSESLNLKVNNRHHHVERMTGVPVPLVDGVLNVSLPYTGLGAPLLTVSCPELLESAFTFNPIIETQRRVNAMQDRSVFRSTQLRGRLGDKLEGSLVPPSVDDASLDAGLKGIRNLLEISLDPKSLARDPAAAGYADEGLARQGVFLHASGARQGSELDLAHLNPIEHDFSLRIARGGNVTFFDAAQTAELVQASLAKRGADETGLLSSAADLLASLWQNVKRTVSDFMTASFQVIADGVKLVLEIGGKVFSAVLSTLEAVGHAIKTLFEAALKLVDDLFIKYVAVYLPWQDIRGAYRLLSTVFTVGSDKLQRGIADAGTRIDGFLGTAQTELAVVRDGFRERIGREVSADRMSSDAARTRAEAGHPEEQASWLAFLRDNPVFEWIKTHVMSAIEAITSVLPAFPDRLDAEMKRFFDNDFRRFLDTETDTIKNFLATLRFDATLKYDAVTLVELFLSDAGLALLGGLRGFLRLLFDFISAIGRMVIDVLANTELTLPFLTTMFHSEAALGEVNGKSSILELMTMAAAIPVGCITRMIGFDVSHYEHARALVANDSTAAESAAIPYWAITIPEVIGHVLGMLDTASSAVVMFQDQIPETVYRWFTLAKVALKALRASCASAVVILKEQLVTGGLPWSTWVGLVFDWVKMLASVAQLMTKSWGVELVERCAAVFRALEPTLRSIVAAPGAALDGEALSDIAAGIDVKKLVFGLFKVLLDFASFIWHVVSVVLFGVRGSDKRIDQFTLGILMTEAIGSFSKTVADLMKTLWPPLGLVPPPAGPVVRGVAGVVGVGGYGIVELGHLVSIGLSITLGVLESA